MVINVGILGCKQPQVYFEVVYYQHGQTFGLFFYLGEFTFSDSRMFEITTADDMGACLQI